MSVPDGTLVAWDEIAAGHRWDTLLLGNGLSINVWSPFAYRELFDHASNAHLTAQDCELFEGTPNFELVLGDLRTAIRVSRVLGLNTDLLEERYRSIQAALGHAVRAVHLRRTDVADATLATIRAELSRYEWVFTTSYDLLVYWAMAYGDAFAPFVDAFRSGRFSLAPIEAGQVPVYFLHGALHLVVKGDGSTRKLARSQVGTLLDQFGQPIDGDTLARPLLVTEGSARDKAQVIDGNEYLSHARDRLRQRSGPIVVFGSSLSEQDSHLTDVLSEHANRPVAVSMLPAGKRDLARQQSEIFGRIEAAPLLFFDALSHPLGDPWLRVPLG